jgi:hypothetical protein
VKDFDSAEDARLNSDIAVDAMRERDGARHYWPGSSPSIISKISRFNSLNRANQEARSSCKR